MMLAERAVMSGFAALNNSKSKKSEGILAFLFAIYSGF
jgi:hypothetical protein